MPTFVSPVLKWPAPGKAPAGGKVDFAFDPSSLPGRRPLAHAIRVAVVLGAPQIRVFSYLRYPGFQPGRSRGADGSPADRSRRATTTSRVEIENEPVCNIGSTAPSSPATSPRSSEPSPWLRPLVDIGNSWSMGQPPQRRRHRTLAPLVDLIHLKDRDFDGQAHRAAGRRQGAVGRAS